jgi:hypothetical protein
MPNQYSNMSKGEARAFGALTIFLFLTIIAFVVLISSCKVSESRVEGSQLQSCVNMCGSIDKVDFLRKVGGFEWYCHCENGKWHKL